MITGIYTVMINKCKFILLIAIVGLFSCSQNKKISQKKMNETIQEKNDLSQSKDDLLAGVSSAVCYSGFRSGQHPDRGYGAVVPSYDEVLEDLKIVSENMNFNLIRIYDCGENSEMILRVIRENNIDIKVLLGIWLRAELSNHNTCAWLTEPIPDVELQQNKTDNLLEIENGIKLANQYNDIIVAVNVGNEVLVDWNDHKVDTDTIISYVNRVKEAIKQPVTVADNYRWWADHGTDLAAVVDFVSLHIYPVWEGKDIDEGMSYSIENFKDVQKALPNAKFVITEAGWPSIASEFGDRASEEKQQLYYKELMQWAKEMNITTFWFEAFDEDWKGETANPLGAEKHWGIYTVDRIPKKVMK